MTDEIWHLHHQGARVAALHVTERDFPWLTARVVPLPGYAAVADLLAEELRLHEASEDAETPEWTAAYRRIREVTRLTRPDGSEVPEYLLHVDGDEAWWRWSDTPFDVDD